MKIPYRFTFAFCLISFTLCLILTACGSIQLPPETTSPTVSQPEIEISSESTESTDAPTEPDPTTSPYADTILAYLPEYTYSGVLAGTYDMSAEGMYFAKGSTKQYDPLLNGNPIVDDLGGGMMWVYRKVSASAMEAYSTDLANAGYTLYSDNELNQNLFSTWVSADHVVTLSYLASRKEFSILIEPMRALPGLAQDNVCVNENIPCKAILAPTSHTGRENGQCLILQLCDGSFVIVDGGHGIGFYPSDKEGFEETYDDNAEEIYQILRAFAPDPEKIVIAAWFFTHPHWDHIGAIGPFADMYGGSVTVEKFILNHPNHNTIQQMWDKSDANLLYVPKMQKAFAKFPEASIIEAHAGQVFYLRNAVIDVLLTWELQTQYSPDFESVSTMNSASLILDVEICGERLIVLGDSGVSSTAYLNKLYGSWLKSDMVSIAHHGYQGADAALYRNIDADIVLWPINREDVTDLLNEKRNRPLKEADKIWVVGKSITVLPLPYTTDSDVIVFEAPVLTGRQWDDVYPASP